jgi:hypothetical protein
MIARRALFASTLMVAGLGTVSWLADTRQAAADVTVGKQAPDFAVTDTQGRVRKLSEFRGKTVVLEWTSSSCPFVTAQYQSGNMPALQRWAAEQNIVWLSVVSTHPSRRDYLEPAKAEAFELGRGAKPTAILMDGDGKLGRSYGARTTPHMYIVAPDATLVYAGAIDDQPSYDASVVKGSKNFVRAALEDLGAGRPVAVSSTRPYGCSVGYGS